MSAMFVLIALVFALTLITVEHNNVALLTPSRAAQQRTAEAGEFLSYRDAVTNYAVSHPAFVGAVPLTSLSGSYSATFASGAGNFVTSAGTNARVITSYAAVAGGTVAAAIKQSGGDASIGTSSGSTWVSAGPGASVAPQPLNTSVPAGDIVSVLEIGS